jgi:hypothetical protein
VALRARLEEGDEVERHRLAGRYGRNDFRSRRASTSGGTRWRGV